MSHLNDETVHIVHAPYRYCYYYLHRFTLDCRYTYIKSFYIFLYIKKSKKEAKSLKYQNVFVI